MQRAEFAGALSLATDLATGQPAELIGARLREDLCLVAGAAIEARVGAPV